MLDYELSLPDNPADGAPVIVLLHGRGSHKGDLMGLRPALPRRAVVVTPQAPFSGAPWGYGDGWAWYRFLGGRTPESESFETGQRALEEFIGALPSLLPVRPGPLVLGGFSQGATTSLAYALRHPGEVDSVLIFSGFLAEHPSVAATPETIAGRRFFWGHGAADPMIPFAAAVDGRAALRAGGGNVEARDYQIGHWIDPVELEDAARWLDEAVVTSGAAVSTPVALGQARDQR